MSKEIQQNRWDDETKETTTNDERISESQT
jgi:hypothetical protein